MNIRRVVRLVDRVIRKHKLDLKEIVVLTEAGSNNYILTPVIAARAGAKEVWAVTKDSEYGLASEITQATYDLASICGVSDNIHILREKTKGIISKADIVTNLGFVRPIDSIMIDMIARHAVIPLMYASWEFRDTDLDLQACNRKGIPVMGTNENRGAANVLPFCGTLCVKIMLEAGLEVSQNKIIVFSRDMFGPILRDTLRSFGANVTMVKELREEAARKELMDADCLIVSDYESKRIIIGREGYISAKELSSIAPGITVVQFTGLVDADSLKRCNIECYPPKMLPPKRMSRTLADLGPLPVLELHTAGLKVGQAMFKAKEQGLKGEQFLKYVKRISCAEEIPGAQY